MLPSLSDGTRQELLEYDARHRVLICRQCQYAIQKSAVPSHLLRHKIYREQKQRLLSAIAQLDLCEPHEVPLPAPDSPPVGALPIIPGYRCTAPACGALYASTKGIRRHQNESHSFSEPGLFSASSRPANLQTFFRGPKLRYFEVTCPPGTTPSSSGPTSTVHEDDAGSADLDRRPSSSPSTDFNLEVLAYLHHFTTSTCLTLPRTNFGYWQSQVVPHALQRKWLMCGILAISAHHLASLAALARDPVAEQAHRDRAVRFYSDFISSWSDASVDLALESFGFVANDEISTQASAQIRSILRCAQWALAESSVNQRAVVDPSGLSPFHCIMETIQSFGISLLLGDDPDGGASSGAEGAQDAFSQASSILQTQTSNEKLSAMLERLKDLPSRMAEALGRPDDTHDVLIMLSAIAALVKCCSASFEETDPALAFNSMAKWIAAVPRRFHALVTLQSPAALVVLAHWAALLVKQAEHCGCWYLNSLWRVIVLQIAEQLAVENYSIQDLIKGLENG